MAHVFSRFFSRPEETKVSRTAPLIALAGLGRPVWSTHDSTEMVRHAYGRNAVVFRCVRMIAEAVATIPVYLARRPSDAPDHPMELLLARPNPRQTGRDLMENAVANLLLFGDAYLELVSDGVAPREIYCLRPDRIKVHPGPDGWPQAYEYSANGGSVLLRTDGDGMPPVLHLRMFDPLDDHYGQAPLQAARMPLDIHNAASEWNKALLDNSARPSGALVYAQGGANLSDEQFARLKEELETAFTGPLNAGRPMLLEGGLDWKPLALSPKDMDFMQVKAAAARDIALALGVPPLLLGLPGDNTHANYAEASRALWRQTAIPLARRIADGLAHWLAPAYGEKLILELDLDQIEALAPEREAKMKAMARADYMTVNEKRAVLGLPARADGDAFVSGRGVRIDLGDTAEIVGEAAPASLMRKFDPGQPRVPAGSAEGGQWTDGGGGGGDIVDVVSDAIADAIGEYIFSPVDLRLEEGGMHGGHSIARHVGRSDDDLLSELYASRISRNTGSIRITNQKEAVGSFDSIDSANDFVNRVLENNKQKIDDLISLKSGSRSTLEYRFGYKTGREAWSTSNDAEAEIRWTYAVRLIAVRDSISERGFRILTAFPINSKSQ